MENDLNKRDAQTSEAQKDGTAQKGRGRNLFRGLAPALRRYFALYAACALAAALLIYLVYVPDMNKDVMPYLLDAALLGAFAFAAEQFCLRAGAKWYVEGLLLLACAAGAAAFHVFAEGWTDAWKYLVFACLAASGACVGFALPKSGEDVARYSVRAALRAVLSGVAVGILSGGCAIIVFALHALFAIEIDKLIQIVLIALWFLVYPLVVFPGLLPRQEEARHNRALNAFMTYGILPLLAALTAIFYAYLIKILTSGVWPEGEVAPLALLGSAVAAAILFFFAGERDTRAWKLFSRVFPILWLLPLFMLGWAVVIRLDAYGPTPERLMLLVLGAWTLVVLLMALLFGRRFPAKFVPLSLACALLLAIFAPAVNVRSLSIKGQTARLAASLSRADMGTPEAVIPNPDVSDADKRAIAGAAGWLYVNDANAVTGFDGSNYAQVFGFSWTDETYAQDAYLYADAYEQAYDVSDARALFRDLYLSADYDGEAAGIALHAGVEKGYNGVTVTVDGKEAAFDLDAAALDALSAYAAGEENWREAELSESGVRVRVLFTYLYGVPGDTPESYNYDLLVLD